MDALTLGLASLLAIVVLIAVVSVCRVPPGHSWTVARLGSYHRTLGPGIHFIVPFLDRITHRVSMLGQVLGVECDALPTRDDRRVDARGRLYFQILDPRKASTRLNSLEDAAQSLTAAKARDLVQQLDLDSLQQRTTDEINAWLLGLLNESATQWGVRVTRIEMDFSDRDEDAAQS